MSGNIQKLPILPMRTMIVFPHCVEMMQISRPRSLRLLKELTESRDPIAMVPLRNGGDQVNSVDDLCDIGVLARPLVIQPSKDETLSVTFEATRRLALERLISDDPYLVGEFSEIEEESVSSAIEKTAQKVYSYAVRLLHSDSHYTPEIYEIFKANRDDLSRFVDVVSHHLHFSFEAKRELLIGKSLRERMICLLDFLSEECQRLELEDELKIKVEDAINKSQREFFLRAKLKEIRRELGEDYEDDNAAASYRKRISVLSDLPIEVKEQLLLETERLKILSTASAEYGSIKRYLDWLLAIPWTHIRSDKKDLNAVEKIIDRNFFGGDDIKERITEYLATRQLSEEVSAPVLCMCGPLGTGKASLAGSIATALDRELVRFSVAGFSSVAELRGEPHTLEGAMPGKIVRSLIDTDCMNPVFLIEDLDKLAGDEGRVAIALAFLDLIDPRQNRRYFDDYVSLPIDLSRVIFIFSMHSAELVPDSLLERMEVIEFSGYVDREKIAIAEKHLVPSLLAKHGIEPLELKISTGALRNLIRSYTMEAGLSQVKARIESLCRKYSKAKATASKPVKWVVTEDNLEKYFGPPIFIPETAESQPEIGVAAGVAWTGAGGDIMMIEGLKMRGSGGVVCTGSLGDVMRESVQAAHSFVRSKADLLQIPYDDFAHYDIHIHFPQGAIPKDGPSAGVTISLVMASVMSDRPIRNDIAMTGEVSLRGKVLAVSGIKEKVAAAHRAGIFKIVLPAQNKKDVKHLPRELREQMEFIYIERTDELFEIALLDYEPGSETLQDLMMMELRRQAADEESLPQKSKVKRSAKRRKSGSDDGTPDSKKPSRNKGKTKRKRNK